MGADRRFDSQDFRATNPRFTPDALAANQSLIELIRPIALAHGATIAQVALAWLLEFAPTIIPIPGTRNPEHLRENAAAVNLTLHADEIAFLTALPAPEGSRY
jgi:aryl-alcohol dehydrogenase-like predicted oxidoreductase